MKRLTKEQLENYRNTYDRYEGIESNVFEEICNELIEYKLLEEDLGIDLITLFKALKQDYIYFKYHYGWDNKTRIEKQYISGIKYVDDNNMGLWLNDFGKEHLVYIKDYGKTWSLRKEDLEDEKED